MSKVIFLADHTALRTATVPQGTLPAAGQPVLDRLARPMRDLRISVTDRCNFRCTYCMPREVFDGNYTFMPHSALLSFEEITRVAGLAAQLGVEKIRLTGGEPLLRKNIEVLIGMLAELRTPAGKPLELTLTTNGILLRRKAAALKAAGLNRVTVSLDALDAEMFARLSDSKYTPVDVLDGIAAASEAGLQPVKVNMVVRRGLNDDQIVPMARHFRHTGQVLRFIEYMDVGNTNGWNMKEVVPSSEVLQRIGQEFPLTALEADVMGRVAERWAYTDGGGEIGVISSVTQAFCSGCTRARLSPEGKIFLCLFGSEGHDLRGLLRSGADDEEVARAMAGIWSQREDRYSELRSEGAPVLPVGERKVEMSYIGG
ncbi:MULTISPECIES: GTP 3',8-cyclase MoaA [unclassified Bordetella]|uniref:GTP 3',8-cyclase MoaA n=1 Tax=unclassified Bordetella TaxID=2630031 RepID=UPI001325F884|nr:MULTISPECIES: GTP 3',8-cyclase MoaA [unclassified Bordetella]MVW70885.1 GTP 3',8-cyclase MoaA [Bordetella sp. 15P40C-2]MVW79518.1 GTP 3',8-cyclase MoaA [Bordetella sp. 02P26C-1]